MQGCAALAPPLAQLKPAGHSEQPPELPAQFVIPVPAEVKPGEQVQAEHGIHGLELKVPAGHGAHEPPVPEHDDDAFTRLV